MATSIRFTVPDQVKGEEPEEPQLHSLLAFERQSENRIDVADDCRSAIRSFSRRSGFSTGANATPAD